MRDKTLYESAEMKKRQYKYLYAKMLDKNLIIKAWKNLRKGKTKRKAVKRIERNFDEEVDSMQEMIKNTKPPDVTVENPELAYEPPKIRKTKVVHEFGKKRIAYLAEIREQWYFHIIVEVLKPIIITRLQPGVCGCIPGRGMHSGMKRIKKHIKQGKNIRYFVKMDIRHFYANVRIEQVIKQMRTLIGDEWFLYCIEKIYKYQKKGILIGLYISPWISNFLLMNMDKTISQYKQFHYTRYVDDIVIFGNSKKELRKLLVLIKKMLGSMRLKLKRTYQICKFDYETKRIRIVKGIEDKIHIGRPLDFMGFQFYRNKIILRKHIMLGTVKSAKLIHKAKTSGRRIWNKLARSFISRIGWFSCTDTYNCYLKYIKPYVQINYIKRLISKLDRKRNKEELKNGRKLEERSVCYAT